jgi:C-terminal processing protease CtpA/Prc
MLSEGYQRQTQDNQQHDIVGIGCEIELLGDYHAISHVHVDGPANSAGLQQGCIIRAIDYRPVKGFDTARLQSMILGPRMSKVILTIQRPGYDEIEDITVVRC